MLRRTTLAASLGGAILACSGSAHASGAWLSSGPLTPVEQRVAVAVGPLRTTLWTSLRFDASGGTVAILVPAPAGSALDISSDAWFEALEVATAPRIFPPPNVSPFCPGKSGPPSIFQLDGETAHQQSLAPQTVSVLADVPAVTAWAAQAELTISDALYASLNALTGVQFVAIQFQAPSGVSVTPTLRIAMPGAPPVLPLALTRAGATDLRVTTWLFGEGEASLVDGSQVAIPLKSLVWQAGAGSSNYDTLRADALAPGADTFLVESASHDAIVENTSIGGGTAFIDGVVTTFFERAAAYGDGSFDSAACIAAATPLLSSTMTVAPSCPPGALGFIQPAPACTESTPPGEVNPEGLRCGPGADDLAIALSSLMPASTWVTRETLFIPGGSGGVDSLIGFAGSAPTSPVLDAQSVDVSDCGDAGSGSSTSATSSSGVSSGAGAGSGSSSSGAVSTGSSGQPCGGIDFGGVDLSIDDTDDASDGSCSCDGTSSTSADSTTATDDSSGSCDGSDPSSGGCSGNSSGSDGSDGSSGCSGSGSSDGSSGCSGSGSSGDDCSGGSSGGDGCSGGSGGNNFNCTILGARRVRAPKMSIVLMIALAITAPLRRRGRRHRTRPLAAT